MQLSKYNINYLTNNLLTKTMDRGELILMRTILSELKLGDTSAPIKLANSLLGRLMGVKVETVRKRKEALHAQGVILIDGLTWEEYTDDEGRRFHTGETQEISLASKFVDFLSKGLECYKQLRGRALSVWVHTHWIFHKSLVYLEKIRKQVEKSKLAQKKHWAKIYGRPFVATLTKAKHAEGSKDFVMGLKSKMLATIASLGKLEFDRKAKLEVGAVVKNQFSKIRELFKQDDDYQRKAMTQYFGTQQKSLVERYDISAMEADLFLNECYRAS